MLIILPIHNITAFCFSVLSTHAHSVRVGHRVWGVLVFLLYWELHRSCHLEEVHWEEGAKCRSISHVQQLKAMSMTGQNPLPVLTDDEPYDKRCQDPTICSVKFFIVRGRCSSRRERVHESQIMGDTENFEVYFKECLRILSLKKNI